VPLRAITALCVHGAKKTGEVSSLWGEQEVLAVSRAR
jgi:hypothetical protein